MNIRALIEDNVLLLDQDISLLKELSEELYVKSFQPYHASIGEQYRHVLRRYEDILSFDTCIDYTQPEREEEGYKKPEHVQRLETDKEYTLQYTKELMCKLLSLREDKWVDVIETAGEKKVKVPSTLSRELADASNHTVHHHAMIATLLSQEHFTHLARFLDKGYGFNPATIHARKHV
jgi:uncharacterized damage-inducible protein DinB